MAPMMFFELPSRTKNVPRIEVTMHTPPISSGRLISGNSRLPSPWTSNAVSTIVAPIVTT